MTAVHRIALSIMLLAVVTAAASSEEPAATAGRRRAVQRPPARPRVTTVPLLYRNEGFVIISEPDGSRKTRLVMGGFTPSWSPHGTGAPSDPFYFASTDSTEHQLQTFAVWIDDRGSILSAIKDVLYIAPNWIQKPKWSPTGGQIAFLDEQRAIKTIPSKGGLPTEIYVAGPGRQIMAIDWFRDSQRLAVVERAANDYLISIVDTTTGNASSLIPPGTFAQISSVSVGRTRDRIAFSGRTPSDTVAWIYLYQADGEPATPLTPGFQVAWSDDDTRIAFMNDDWLQMIRLATRTIDRVERGAISPDWRR